MVVVRNLIWFKSAIDQDGDGEFDVQVQPSSILSEEESSDINPPETEIIVSGSKKRDYFIHALIDLSADDDSSGVHRTHYSLDGGQTWQTYTEPFNLTKSGEIVFKYFSTDKAGNTEAINEETILNIGLEVYPAEEDPIIIYPG